MEHPKSATFEVALFVFVSIKKRTLLAPRGTRFVVVYVVQEQEDQRRFARSRLQMMEGYVSTTSCRREFLLSYFGEAFALPCDACDNCCRQTSAFNSEESGGVAAHIARVDSHHETARPFAIGARVAHKTLGQGQVLRYEGDKITVLFDKSGYSTLALQIVEKNGLLTDVKVSA